MIIEEHYSLKSHNTFHVDAVCRYFVVVERLDELLSLIKSLHQTEYDYPLKLPWNVTTGQNTFPVLILGGGSNILFTGDFPGIVIHIALRGIQKVREDERYVWMKAYAGEIWHDLVMYSVNRNLCGIENLSLIPGSTGAAPIQNIGAYGVEIREVLEEVEVIDVATGEIATFTNEMCAFAYRDSIFKQKLKGKKIVVSVTLRLSKVPELKLHYGNLKETLAQMGVQHPTVKAVSDAVIHIRRSKLPDPRITGNAGSFFKNPEIDEMTLAALTKTYPEIPYFPLPGNKFKIPAAWLIEQCGWKGKRLGNAAVHEKHALVLINTGKATGQEILALSKKIQHDVLEKFGIALQPEVNII